jgi:hypothetical protein
MTPHHRATKAPSKFAGLDSVTQWDAEGKSSTTESVSHRAETLDPRLCTWAQIKMPEVDSAGLRTTRTNWNSVNRDLKRLGLPQIDSAKQKSLRSPMSPEPGVLTMFGAFVVEAKDNRFGTRRGIRIVRLALAPIDGHVLASARHRDGLDWIDPRDGASSSLLRAIALRKRDPLRPTSLRSAVTTSGRVTAAMSAEELALEVIYAATLAFPRSVHARLSAYLSEAEEGFAQDAGRQSEVGSAGETSRLLHLIAAVGRLELEVRAVHEDFLQRTGDWSPVPRISEIDENYKTILARLERLRADARTVVDMFSSAVSSAQLELARTEARSAASERDRRDREADARRSAEDGVRRREQRLARVIAVATSVLLIPTLVASIFGANIKLPREGSVWETWLMVACMLGLGSGAYAALQTLDPTRERVRLIARIVPIAISGAALIAAVLIAADCKLPW